MELCDGKIVIMCNHSFSNFLIFNYHIKGYNIITKLVNYTLKKEKVLPKDMSNFSLYKSLLKKFYKSSWECQSVTDYDTVFVCKELNCLIVIVYMLQDNSILSVNVTVNKINGKNYNMLEREESILDKKFFHDDKLLHTYQFVKYLMKERQKFLSKEGKRTQIKDMLIERLNEKNANN